MTALLRALESTDRGERIRAAFALGEALAGRGSEAGEDKLVRRALAALDTLAKDREAGSWARKRAKRAAKKIRGEAVGAEEPDAA